MALPEHLGELCFSTEAFLERNFHVDEFVSRCRRRVTIQHLRDDLEAYFRTLKSAMVELINKDYADFVNLSANLVGMDKAIDDLISPLGQLREEIMRIKSAMQAAINALEKKLTQRAEIRKRKATIQRVILVVECVDRLERLLGITQQETVVFRIPQSETGEFSDVVMERVSSEFNKLQYNVTLTNEHPMVEDVKLRIASITAKLQSNLERWFRSCLDGGSASGLSRCLLTYASINRQQAAESMFQATVVHPYLDQVISTKLLLTHPRGLPGVYSEILRFVPRHCSHLLEATQPRPLSLQGGTALQDRGGGEGCANGFDFLVNAVWPEIVATLEEKASIIFAPGNPNTFHRNYSASMEFVASFEAVAPSLSSVKRLRAHPSFNAFMSKWSLPVYFQIRFQEIASGLEGKLCLPLVEAKALASEAEEDLPTFHLELFSTLWQCLLKCWREDVFLPALVHRFWKLTLQLMLRTASWLSEATASSSEQQQQQQQQGGSGKLPSNTNSSGEFLSVDGCLLLIRDCEQLADQVLSLYQTTIKKKFPAEATNSLSVIEGGLEESRDKLRQLVPVFEASITREVAQQCSRNLESANTIARLFRRTNREAPRKASNYVSNIFKPLSNLRRSGALPQGYYTHWCLTIVGSVSERYLAIMSDLLVSVKRTEDSLLKLQKSRKSNAPAPSGGLSDDNKIRLQVALDIGEYAVQVTSFSLPPNAIPTLSRLIDLGHAAKATALTTP